MITKKNRARPDIIVVGGGAAGLMAAGRAAERGAKVTLVEKTHRLGNKLLLTGGGRCNITNKAGLKEFGNAFGKNGRFLYRAFTVFSNRDLIHILTQYGKHAFNTIIGGEDLPVGIHPHFQSIGAEEMNAGKAIVAAGGEMMDVDGMTGGYNLQAAFSTGYLAGESAAQIQ